MTGHPKILFVFRRNFLLLVIITNCIESNTVAANIAELSEQVLYMERMSLLYGWLLPLPTSGTCKPTCALSNVSVSHLH